jgi:hypothetical protein
MYCDNTPITSTDPLGLLKPSDPRCVRELEKIMRNREQIKGAKEKMKHIEEKLRNRARDQIENKLDLPETHPDDFSHPGLSRRGHTRVMAEAIQKLDQMRRILGRKEDALASQEERYRRNCSDPESGPEPEPRPVPQPEPEAKPIPIEIEPGLEPTIAPWEVVIGIYYLGSQAAY